MRREILDEISRLVRTGFYSTGEILQMACDEWGDSDEVDPGQLADAIDTARDAFAHEQRGWPAVTDCDRLDLAFDALSGAGLIALQNAGFTQGEGYEEVREAYDRARAGSGDASDIVGFCFYNGQDLESVMRGGELFVAFGPIDPSDEEAEGPKVGQRVAAALAEQGFTVDWDGTFGKRIRVTQIDWKRRGQVTNLAP